MKVLLIGFLALSSLNVFALDQETIITALSAPNSEGGFQTSNGHAAIYCSKSNNTGSGMSVFSKGHTTSIQYIFEDNSDCSALQTAFKRNNVAPDSPLDIVIRDFVITGIRIHK